jgi:tetratricopeptide (TPR) repeat protein
MKKNTTTQFRKAIICLSLGLGLSFSSMGQLSYAATDTPVEPANDLTPNILYQVLAAEIAAQRGQLATAANTYLALAKSTRDSRLAQRATEIYLGERSLDGALQSAQLWAELAPSNVIATNTLEALYANTGRLTLLEPLLVKKLLKAREDKQSTEAYTAIERLLTRSPDRRASFDMLDRISKPDQSVATARLALANLAANAGQLPRAASEALAASRLLPDDEAMIVSAAAYEQQASQSAKGALAIIKPFVDRNPKAVEPNIIYGRLLAIDGQLDAGRKQLEKVLATDKNNPSILYSLAQVSTQLKQPKDAKQYLDQFIALPRDIQRDNNSAFMFHGQIAEDEKEFAQAIDWYSKIQRGEQFMPALNRRALLLGKTNRLAEARTLLQSISPSTPRERLQLLSAEASVLRQANQHEEVFSLLNSALEKSPNNADLLYEQAMAADKINKLDVMEQSIRKLLTIEPTRADAYNALGYTLADRNLRLPEAFTLIEKALELSPDSGAILDSMGWVLFRMNRIPEAITYLRRAFKASPDAEVAVHLGEALWRAGNADEAKQFWREAKEKEPTNDVLKETLTRLNVSI